MRLWFTKESFEVLPYREDCEYYVPGNYYKIKSCSWVVAQFQSYHPFEWYVYDILVK